MIWMKYYQVRMISQFSTPFISNKEFNILKNRIIHCYFTHRIFSCFSLYMDSRWEKSIWEIKHALNLQTLETNVLSEDSQREKNLQLIFLASIFFIQNLSACSSIWKKIKTRPSLAKIRSIIWIFCSLDGLFSSNKIHFIIAGRDAIRKKYHLVICVEKSLPRIIIKLATKLFIIRTSE